MAYEAEGQRIASQLQEQFGRLLEARLDSPITLVFEHGQWVVPSNFIFKFGYAGSGPDCFHAFLEAAGFHVAKSQIEQAKAGELFRAPGYAPVDPAVAAAQAAAAAREQARKDHERAVGLMDQGQLREALNLFIDVRAAIADDPHPMNRLNIAVCHARLGEFKEALAVLEEAMRLWPDDERLRANYEAIRDDAPKPGPALRPPVLAAAPPLPPLAPFPDDLALPPLAPPPPKVVPMPPFAPAAPARVQSSAGVSSPPPPIPPAAPPITPPSHHPAPAAAPPEPVWPVKSPPGYDDAAATFIRGAGTPLPGVTPGAPAAPKPPVPAPKPAAKVPAKPAARSGGNNNAMGLAALAVVAALVVGVSGWWILSSDSAAPAPAATEQPATPVPDASQPAAAPPAAPPIGESPATAPPVPATPAPEIAIVAPPAPPGPPPPSRPATRPAAAGGARGTTGAGTRTPASAEPAASAPDPAAARAAARREFDLGTAAEGGNDLTAALQHFQAARRLDGGFAEAQAAITRVTGRMNTEGNDAFVRARQYDALDRTEQAITRYERAFRSLPDDNPNRRVARERLDALRRR